MSAVQGIQGLSEADVTRAKRLLKKWVEDPIRPTLEKYVRGIRYNFTGIAIPNLISAFEELAKAEQAPAAAPPETPRGATWSRDEEEFIRALLNDFDPAGSLGTLVTQSVALFPGRSYKDVWERFSAFKKDKPTSPTAPPESAPPANEDREEPGVKKFRWTPEETARFDEVMLKRPANKAMHAYVQEIGPQFPGRPYGSLSFKGYGWMEKNKERWLEAQSAPAETKPTTPTAAVASATPPAPPNAPPPATVIPSAPAVETAYPKKGDVYKAEVLFTKDYGVFVDVYVGDKVYYGLVHVTQIYGAVVGYPDEDFRPGDELEVTFHMRSSPSTGKLPPGDPRISGGYEWTLLSPKPALKRKEQSTVAFESAAPALAPRIPPALTPASASALTGNVTTAARLRTLMEQLLTEVDAATNANRVSQASVDRLQKAEAIIDGALKALRDYDLRGAVKLLEEYSASK